MSQLLLRSGIAVLASTVAVGGIVVGVSAWASDDGADPPYANREDSAKDWVVSADDDDDSRADDTASDEDRDTGRPSRTTRGSDQPNTNTDRSADSTHSNQSRDGRSQHGSRDDGSRHGFADDISVDASGSGGSGDT